MDAISHVIRLAHLEGVLDTRCLFRGHTVAKHPEELQIVPFHLLLEGSCEIELEDRTLFLAEGDVVLLTRGQAHAVHTGAGSEPEVDRTDGAAFTTARAQGAGSLVDLFCGHYTFREGVGDLFFSTLPEVVHVNLQTRGNNHMRALTALMREEADNEGPGSAAILSSLCDVLLTLALRQAPARNSHLQRLWTAIDDENLRSVIDLLFREPERPWTIVELAERAAMSRATFIRRFTKAAGTSVGTFLTRIRMLIAAELRAETDKSIGDIAAAVGFASESSFGRAFRAATATTPARFRHTADARRPDLATGMVR